MIDTSNKLKLKDLKTVNSKMRKYSKYEPPQPINDNLPPLYNIILSASVKGAGKTFSCVELMTAYENSGFKNEKGEKCQMRIIYISGGTAQSKQNSILDTLKTLHKNDRLNIDDGGDDILNDIYDSLLAERDTIVDYNLYRDVYKKYMKNNISKMTDNELMLLEARSYIDPKEDPNVPTDPDGNKLFNPRVVFLIIDDLISTDNFSNTKRSNFFNKICVKSRHDSDKLCPINLFFISQNIKSIPAIIRRQTDIFVLMKSANRSYIIETISTELGSHFTKDEIIEYYDEIMKIEHGSLILSVHKAEKAHCRIRMGWDKCVVRDPKYLI